MANICLSRLSVLEEIVLLLRVPCAFYFVDYYYVPCLLSVLSESFLYHDQLKVFNRTKVQWFECRIELGIKTSII